MFPDFGKIAEDSADMLATQKAILQVLQEINAKMEVLGQVRAELESPAKTLPSAIADI